MTETTTRVARGTPALIMRAQPRDVATRQTPTWKASARELRAEYDARNAWLIAINSREWM